LNVDVVARNSGEPEKGTTMIDNEIDNENEEETKHTVGHGPGAEDLDSLPPSDFVSFSEPDVEKADDR
jgi:hypothetical protein